jgi:hypothetical protein
VQTSSNKKRVFESWSLFNCEIVIKKWLRVLYNRPQKVNSATIWKLQNINYIMYKFFILQIHASVHGLLNTSCLACSERIWFLLRPVLLAFSGLLRGNIDGTASDFSFGLFWLARHKIERSFEAVWCKMRRTNTWIIYIAWVYSHCEFSPTTLLANLFLLEFCGSWFPQFSVSC